MSAAGDNREGTRRPLTRRPDGSWPLEDARERRQQHDTTKHTTATTATDDPGEDHLAYALSLADSMLTSDGKPCTDQLTAEQEEIESGALLPAIAGEPDRDQPTAQEIIRALEDDQQAATSARRTATRGQPELPPPGSQRPKPTARHRGTPRWLVRWLTAGVVTALVAAGLVLAIASSSATAPGRHPAHTPAAATAAAIGLSGASANIILDVAQNADRKQATRSVWRRHAPRARHAPKRAAARHPSSQHAVSATPTSNTATTPTVTAPAPTAASGSDSSSASSPSGSNPAPAATEPPVTQPATSSRSSAGPSKATLRSLINGAGRCSC